MKTNCNVVIDTEDRVRNNEIAKIMTDLRNSERKALGEHLYSWLVSIGVIKLPCCNKQRTK